jgi:hypothetical protein
MCILHATFEATSANDAPLWPICRRYSRRTTYLDRTAAVLQLIVVAKAACRVPSTISVLETLELGFSSYQQEGKLLRNQDQLINQDDHLRVPQQDGDGHEEDNMLGYSP